MLNKLTYLLQRRIVNKELAKIRAVTGTLEAIPYLLKIYQTITISNGGIRNLTPFSIDSIVPHANIYLSELKRCLSDYRDSGSIKASGYKLEMNNYRLDFWLVDTDTLEYDLVEYCKVVAETIEEIKRLADARKQTTYIDRTCRRHILGYEQLLKTIITIWRTNNE